MKVLCARACMYVCERECACVSVYVCECVHIFGLTYAHYVCILQIKFVKFQIDGQKKKKKKKKKKKIDQNAFVISLSIPKRALKSSNSAHISA